MKQWDGFLISIFCDWKCECIMVETKILVECLSKRTVKIQTPLRKIQIVLDNLARAYTKVMERIVPVGFLGFGKIK